MPKAFSTKNINKLKVYLATNGNQTANTKPNGQTSTGHINQPRAN